MIWSRHASAPPTSIRQSEEMPRFSVSVAEHFSRCRMDLQLLDFLVIRPRVCQVIKADARAQDIA